MKRTLAILLTALLFAGIFAAPAAAAAAIPSSVTVHKGFAKINRNVFVDLKAEYPDMTFEADNNQFSIDRNTGKLTFKTGLASSVVPVDVKVTTGGTTQVVKVTTYYEWYEYFVIIFAAGLFWIAAVNN